MSELIKHLYSEILSAIGKSNDDEFEELSIMCRRGHLRTAWLNERDRRTRMSTYTEEGLQRMSSLHNFFEDYKDALSLTDVSVNSLNLDDAIKTALYKSGVKSIAEAANFVYHKHYIPTVPGIGDKKKLKIQWALYKYVIENVDLDELRSHSFEYYLNDDGKLYFREYSVNLSE